MVKGGVALVAREVTARKTDDLDILGASSRLATNFGHFMDATATDIGDGLEFTLEREPATLTGQDTDGYTGLRIKLACTQGGALLRA